MSAGGHTYMWEGDRERVAAGVASEWQARVAREEERERKCVCEGRESREE